MFIIYVTASLYLSEDASSGLDITNKVLVSA